MIRLNMVVEGQTEETFVRDVLTDHLAAKGVMVSCQQVETGRKRGITYKGGLSSYAKVKRHMQYWMKRDNDRHARFTTMLDLYALPDDFPGCAEARKLADPYDRVKRLETGLQEDLGDHRMLPYIQVHEFEALILSEPSEFGAFFQNHQRAIESLTDLCGGFDSPELIDDGDKTAPSKRIIGFLPEYEEVKATAGPMIAAAIGLQMIRSRCPHFDEWLSGLETLDAAQTEDQAKVAPTPDKGIQAEEPE